MFGDSLERSSLLERFRALAPRLRFPRLMKEERVSLGLQPGSSTAPTLERPGTFSSRSWQPMSLTSNVPVGDQIFFYHKVIDFMSPG